MGNCDGWDVAAWGAPEQLELGLAGVRIAMVHDSGLTKGREARMRRRFPDADLVLFGRSHQPLFERGQEVALLNPGSPTWKRRAPEPTVARLVVEDGSSTRRSGRRDRPQIAPEDHPVRPGEARPVEREPLALGHRLRAAVELGDRQPQRLRLDTSARRTRGWPRRTRGRGPGPSGRGACPSRPPARPRGTSRRAPARPRRSSSNRSARRPPAPRGSGSRGSADSRVPRASRRTCHTAAGGAR